MNKILITIILILVLAAIVAFSGKNGQNEAQVSITPSPSPSPTELESKANMEISSPAFENNSQIPSKYTCDGENISPPLEIKEVPENAQSLALIVDDPDAPTGTFLHWLVWDIAPNTQAINDGSVPQGAVQGTNDFGKESYGGPCPPSGTHRYFFKLYALDKKLGLPAGSKLEDIQKAMEGHIIEQTELMGLYQRGQEA